MKKIYLVVCVVVLFISCNISGKDNNNHHSSLIGKTQKEIEKLQEPTENVEKLKDDFSATSYVWQNDPHPTNTAYVLQFDEENNKVSLVGVVTENGERIAYFIRWICLRKIDNNQIKFDFTPFEKYAENYNIDMFLAYYYDVLKMEKERLEKKENRTEKEEKELKEVKKFLPYYASIEKYKEIDPTLRAYKEAKLQLVSSAKLYKDMNPIGTISADKSTITFPKFFFCYFDDPSKCERPVIHENVIFKRM